MGRCYPLRRPWASRRPNSPLTMLREAPLEGVPDLANIALPRLTAPGSGAGGLKAIIANRYVGVAGAGLLFLLALAGLVILLGPMTPKPPHMKIPLSGVF